MIHNAFAESEAERGRRHSGGVELMSLRLAGVALAIGGLLGPTIASAHSWYPKRCCHDRDCFPADRIERLGDGTLVLGHGKIVVRVTKSFPVEPSPDGKPHFCVWDSGWSLEPRCVFLSAGV